MEEINNLSRVDCAVVCDKLQHRQKTRKGLWSHCIRIWPIFYTDIHGRQ